MASALLRSSLAAIDQHSAGGKLLQQAVQNKLREYMGADYVDEVCAQHACDKEFRNC